MKEKYRKINCKGWRILSAVIAMAVLLVCPVWMAEGTDTAFAAQKTDSGSAAQKTGSDTANSLFKEKKIRQSENAEKTKQALQLMKDVKKALIQLDLDAGDDDDASKMEAAEDESAEETNKWKALKQKYAARKKVKQLILVKYKGGSEARLLLYEKVEPAAEETDDQNAAEDPVPAAEPDADQVKWKKVMACKAYVGQNGINKEKEGDRKTPTGDYTLTCAFGVKKDPGSAMDYTKLNDYLYWCGDRDHYNQMIDIRKYPHSCRGEHLINYTRQYAYAMALNYNKKCVYGKGSAIFLHCFGYNSYTLGCIAVSEDNMKTILKTCEDKTRICIYPK